jgi:hypothetical protein
MENLAELLEPISILLVFFMLVGAMATVVAQIMALVTALRQRDWPKALLFATPFGWLYLSNLIHDSRIFGKPARGLFLRMYWFFIGFRILPQDPMYLRIFKLSVTLAMTSGFILLLSWLMFMFTFWILGQVTMRLPPA